MKNYSRKDRVSEQVRREVAEIIRTELKDPRVGFISITDVEVTPDYAHAKIYFSSMKGDEGLEEILAGLNRAAGFLRRELGRRIHLHTLPQLHFVYDASLARGAELSQIIDKAVAEDVKRNEDEAE